MLLGLPALHELAREGPVTAVMGRAPAAFLRGRVPALAVYREDDPRLLELWAGRRGAGWELLGRPDRGLVVTASDELAATLGLRHVHPDAPGHRALRLLRAPVAVEDVPVPLVTVEPRRADVLLFPGSGGQRKCWQGFPELAQRLLEAGRGVQIVLGPDELERGWEAAWTGFEVITPDLLDTARLCAGARVVVGNDAGTSHLAAVVGARLVVLFGPTRVARWRPVGPRVSVLEGVGAGLSVERVYSAVRST